MPRIEGHTRFLSADDIVDVVIEKEGNTMTDFSINDRAFLQGDWCIVARFDTAHGRLHVHRGWEAGRPRDLEHVPPRDRTHQFEDAMATVKRRWQTWRARMGARP